MVACDSSGQRFCEAIPPAGGCGRDTGSIGSAQDADRLLAGLGVDLIVIVIVGASVLSRKRWLKRQPGVFRGAIQVASGEVKGLRPKWSRGYGRWVDNVLVWTKAPFLLRNVIMATTGDGEQRAAGPDEVKRLGDRPVVVRVRTGDAVVEVAAASEDLELALRRRECGVASPR